jgi:hypothetical protein
MNLLPPGWFAFFHELVQGDGSAGRRGLDYRANNPDVVHALHTGGLGFPMRLNAV